MTNFEMIKTLNAKELAQFLDDTKREECEGIHITDKSGKYIYKSLVRGWENWLNSEATNNEQSNPIPHLEIYWLAGTAITAIIAKRKTQGIATVAPKRITV